MTGKYSTKENIVALETSYWEAMKAKNGLYDRELGQLKAPAGASRRSNCF